MTVLDFFLFVFLAFLLFILIGLMLYACGFAESWTDAFQKMIRFIGKLMAGIGRFFKKTIVAVYHLLNDDDLKKYQQNTALILTPEEMTALISRLSEHPYEAPSLDNATIDNTGIFTVTFGAVGFVPRYSELARDQVKQLIVRVISEFYRENRNFVPFFYVELATSYRAIVHVPLSQYGFEALKHRIEREQLLRRLAYTAEKENGGPLEEKVDLTDERKNQLEDKQ